MKTTLPDKVRAWLSPAFRDKLAELQHRDSMREKAERFAVRNYRQSERTRTDSDGWTSQPWNFTSTRTLTPAVRREMVKRARRIAEENILGTSMLDRLADNVIGEGMTVQPKTSSTRVNNQIEKLWNDWGADARGFYDFASLQRQLFLAWKRDGDLGTRMLTSLGQVLPVETDYIVSPYGDGYLTDLSVSMPDAKVVDGIELTAIGRPSAFHLAVVKDGKRTTVRVPRQQFAYIHDNDRLDRQAVRGVPKLAIMSTLLEQIDGTTEAVVVAHRMAACFGLLRKRESPRSEYDGLPFSANDAQGESQNLFDLEPGMVDFLGPNEAVEQIKPEHPHAGFNDLMTFLIRMVGLRWGMPLELSLLDFSKTNYSSARASMEQAYRGFRVSQKRFAGFLRHIYDWRIHLWVAQGALPDRDDITQATWLGQPWPYLDPKKDAEGTQVAVENMQMTLGEASARRGMTVQEYIEAFARERDLLGNVGLYHPAELVQQQQNKQEPPADDAETETDDEQPSDAENGDDAASQE